jgi:hypothetical protein
MEFHTQYTDTTYNGVVAEQCAVLEGSQDEASRLEPVELAEYVRAKLNLALHLACQGEHERRSGHWAAAEDYQRQWEVVMAEVKRLLPLVRKSGVSLFATGNPRSPQKQR